MGKRGRPRIDLTGQRFGRLVVVSLEKSPRSRPHWRCVCDCGEQRVVYGYSLTSGRTVSCGCFKVAFATLLNLSHGHTRGRSQSPEYSVWEAMIQRGTNPKNRDWKNYGGRGITVCSRWLQFSNFLADMGRRPSPNLSLERVNNDLGYSAENCKWATRKEQRANQRPARKKAA